MPFVATAITAIGAGTFATTAVGKFLTTTFLGRILTSVAFSALKAVLIGKPKTRQAGIRTASTQTGGITPASFILGKYATEGQLVAPPMSHGEDGKTPNAYLTYVIELGDIAGQTFEGLILDGERADLGTEIHEDYGTPILGRFTDYAWVKYYDGSQTVADPMLLDKYGDDPDRPWTAEMIGAGLCYAILTFRYNREIYTSFPKVRFEMGGIPLYDPRLDTSVGGDGPHRWADRATWEPSENTVVQSYNTLRGIDLGQGHIWGGAAEAEDLPLSTWWAEMNKADLGVGKVNGEIERQWRSSYEVFVDDEPATVLEDMLRGCSGRMVENGGIWKIRVGAPGLPLYFFTDDDVIISEPHEKTPFSASRLPFNGVQGVYPDPAALWEPKDAPSLYSAEFEAEDGGQRRVADLTFTATPYPTQVQRVMRAYQQDDRRFRQHVMNLPQDAIPLEPLDVVSWTSAEHGYLAKDWEIGQQIDPLTSGTPRLQLREVDQGDFFWSTDFEVPVDYANLNRTPLAPQPVAGFGLQAAVVEDAEGNHRRPALRIVWNGEGQDDVRGLTWEIRRVGDTETLAGTTIDVTTGQQLVWQNILPNTAYEARGQWVVDRPTEWTDWFQATTGDIRFTEDDFGPSIFDLIDEQGQALLERINLNVDFIRDEYAEADIIARVDTVLEEARLQGLVEENRVEIKAELRDIQSTIVNIQETAVTDQAAVAQSIETLTTDIGDVSGEIETTQISLSELDEQFTTYQLNVSGQFAAQSAYVNQTFYTKLETDQTIAAGISTYQTNVGGLVATVEDTSLSVDGVLAQRTFRTNAAGAIASISLISEGIDGQPGSSIIFDADSIFIGTSNQPGDFRAAFYTSGGLAYIRELMTRDLSVQTAKIAGNAISFRVIGYGGALAGDGTWRDAASVLVTHNSPQNAEAHLSFVFRLNFAQAGPEYDYRLLRNGTVIDQQKDMAAVVNTLSGFEVVTLFSGTADFQLQFRGDNGDVSVAASKLVAEVFLK